MCQQTSKKLGSKTNVPSNYPKISKIREKKQTNYPKNRKFQKMCGQIFQKLEINEKYFVKQKKQKTC